LLEVAQRRAAPSGVASLTWGSAALGAGFAGRQRGASRARLEETLVAIIQPSSGEPELAQPRALDAALDAYTYAYPLILMDARRRLATHVLKADCEQGRGAPVNQFTHLRHLPDPASVEARPSVDMLPSSLWFDVSTEPLVITVPDSEGRYYYLSLRDAYNEAFASPGASTTGTEAQRFAIAGPGWRGALPRGIRIYRSPTPTGCICGSIEVRGEADVAHVARFQASLSAVPWSSWGQVYSPHCGGLELLVPGQEPAVIVSRMRAEQYFTRFCELTRYAPPRAYDHAMLERLRSLRLVPGRPLCYSALPAGVRSALEQAMAVAPVRLEAACARASSRVGSWHVRATPEGVYGTDYRARAAIAFGGGVDAAEDALSYSTVQDTEGMTLDSSRRYTLTFRRAQLPPTHAFWSLTLYDDRCALADTEPGRHALGSRDQLLVAPDGSVTLLIQRERPAAHLVDNWLPAPRSGGFSLTLRLYAPMTAARDCVWKPPPLRRAEELRTAAANRPALVRWSGREAG
jgi:hypothetical protein